jgi:hypothetical protein
VFCFLFSCSCSYFRLLESELCNEYVRSRLGNDGDDTFLIFALSVINDIQCTNIDSSCLHVMSSHWLLSVHRFELVAPGAQGCTYHTFVWL